LFNKNSTAESVKNAANDEYKAGHYEEAVRLYTQAIGKIHLIFDCYLNNIKLTKEYISAKSLCL